MPSLAMYKITPPTDYAEFEKICLDYLEHKYNAEASLFGRKGQAQKGVDILVTLKDHSYIFAQCKKYQSVNVRQLDEWIKKADDCDIPMRELIIAVSVENDAVLQEHICKITTKRSQDGKAPVSILFWDDIVHYIKKDQTMLRMYYPVFYQGQEIKLAEATQKAEDKYPEIIRADTRLRSLFCEETIKYRIEEFLNTDPISGVSLELINYSDACIYAIQKLLFRAPMLTSEDAYYGIEQFLKCLIEYCEFLVNITETNGRGVVIATNRYHTKEEEQSLNRVDELRKNALDRYLELKNF